MLINSFKRYLIGIVSVLLFSHASIAKTVYVTTNGAGSKNGTSWGNAATIQNAVINYVAML